MISLLIINFRTAALARDAVRSARATTSTPLQVVIVDNSCDAREAGALRGEADILIVPETNRGYAGGINAGRPACSGSTIVVSNPDVTFGPQALDRLAQSLGPDVAVSGPALFWDDAHEWWLPPGDLNTAPEKVDEILAGRSTAWREQRDLRRFQKRVAFWSNRKSVAVRMLSGAVLAIRAEDLDAAGGFDERFALYFEEADFLRRISERRKRIVYVPAARCRHIYNQSSAQTGSVAAERYAQSELLYLEKWNGPWLARALKGMERPLAARDAPALQGPLVLDHLEVVIEVSPLPSFTTAAGHFPSSLTIDVPREVRESAGNAPLFLRVVEREPARVLATYKLTP